MEYIFFIFWTYVKKTRSWMLPAEYQKAKIETHLKIWQSI